MRKVALVVAGGFCGTLARYLVAAPLLVLGGWVVPDAQAHVPYDILAINLFGALAMGLLYGLVERGARISPDVRLALGTGFLGAFTTFSTLAYGGDTLIVHGAYTAGVIYLMASVALGIFCAGLGRTAGIWLGTQAGSRPAGARSPWRQQPVASRGGYVTRPTRPASAGIHYSMPHERLRPVDHTLRRAATEQRPHDHPHGDPLGHPHDDTPAQCLADGDAR